MYKLYANVVPITEYGVNILYCFFPKETKMQHSQRDTIPNNIRYVWQIIGKIVIYEPREDRRAR